MVKKKQILGIALFLASILTGFPFGHPVSQGAPAEPVYYLGTLYHDVDGQVGEVAITAKGKHISGLTVVAADGVAFRISGGINKSGVLSGQGRAQKTTVKFTGQVSGSVILGDWTATTRQNRETTVETGTWIVAGVSNPSEYGSADIVLDGVKTRCRVAVFIDDNSTCTAYLLFKVDGNDQSTPLVGTWNTSETGPQLNFLDDPTYGISGDGYFLKSGSKGDLSQSGLKVGTWTAKKL